MKRTIKIWHRIVIIAVAGIVPLAAIALHVIGTSVTGGINFGRLEICSDAEVKTELPQNEQKTDAALGAVALIYNGELGQALKFNAAVLVSWQRDNHSRDNGSVIPMEGDSRIFNRLHGRNASSS